MSPTERPQPPGHRFSLKDLLPGVKESREPFHPVSPTHQAKVSSWVTRTQCYLEQRSRSSLLSIKKTCGLKL